MHTIDRADSSSLLDTSNLDTKNTVPIYSLTTQGSHPLVICQACNSNNEDITTTKSMLQPSFVENYLVFIPINVTMLLLSPATPQVTSPVIPHATHIPTVSPEVQDIPQSTSDRDSICYPNRIFDLHYLEKGKCTLEFLYYMWKRAL